MSTNELIEKELKNYGFSLKEFEIPELKEQPKWMKKWLSGNKLNSMEIGFKEEYLKQLQRQREELEEEQFEKMEQQQKEIEEEQAQNGNVKENETSNTNGNVIEEDSEQRNSNYLGEEYKKAFQGKFDRVQTIEKTHKRQTFLLEKETIRRMNRLSKEKPKGFKTHFVNFAIKKLLDEIEGEQLK